jgi:hypothetical protein
MAGGAIPWVRRRGLVFGVVTALALLVVVGRLGQGFMAPRRPTPAPAPVTTTARALPVTATIRLGLAQAPQFTGWSQLMVGEGRLWTVVDGVLVGIDPRRPSVVARIRLGQPGGFANLLAVGAGAVWVATGAGGTGASVVRVDATTKVAATLPADNLQWVAGAGAGSLWSVRCTSEDGPCRLLRLDPRGLRVLAGFPLPGLPAGPLVVGEGGAWLLGQRGGWVWRVDLAGGRVVRVQLPSAASSVDVPSQLVVGEGAVWVLTSIERPTALGSRVDAGLVRIDPHTNRVSAVTPLANLVGDTEQVQLAVGAGGVWVQGQERAEGGLAHAVIDRVDSASGRLRGTIETGDLNPAALAAGFGALWLLRPAADVLLRLDPAAM